VQAIARLVSTGPTTSKNTYRGQDHRVHGGARLGEGLRGGKPETHGHAGLRQHAEADPGRLPSGVARSEATGEAGHELAQAAGGDVRDSEAARGQHRRELEMRTRQREEDDVHGILDRPQRAEHPLAVAPALLDRGHNHTGRERREQTGEAERLGRSHHQQHGDEAEREQLAVFEDALEQPCQR